MSAILFNGCKKTIDQQSEETEVSKTNNAKGSRSFCNLPKLKAITNRALAKSVALNETVYNTDFTSAGVGGMRNQGIGTIALSGVSGTVTKAYLYWHGVSNSVTDAGAVILVNASSVSGTTLGMSSDNCWGFNNSQAYRADVTALVQGAGNGNYELSGFGDLNPNGASMIVFFNDGDNSNNRDVVIFDGNDSNIDFAGFIGNPNAPADPTGWNVLLSGINYTAGTANFQLHVADGQIFSDDALIVNTVTLVPAGSIFSGNSVPGANTGPEGNGNLWDIKTYDVTSFLSPGPNSLHLTTGVGSDCIALIAALVDLPAGAAPTTDITVAFDVKPAGCPNPVNIGSMGVTPTAILGTATFDVSKIDVSTVKLNGVSPSHSSMEDVGTPYAGSLVDCNSCKSAGADGNTDLTLKFSTQLLKTALGAVIDNQCVEVTVSGNLKAEFGGTPFTGKDIIRIIKKGKN